MLLRLSRLDSQSFWNDEILTIDNAGAPALDVLLQPRDPNILPLYYLTVRSLVGHQPPELWLRLPSALVGALSIPLLYAILTQWAGRSVGLVAAALLTFSPFHLWYSQEARPYALLLLLSLAALRLMQIALEHPSPPRKAAVAVASAAVFYCHTIGLGFLAFLALHPLLVLPRHRWREWLAPAIGTALLVSPGLVRLLLFPPEGSASVFKDPSFWSVGYAAWTFAFGYSLGPTMDEVHRQTAGQILGGHLAVVVSGAALIGGLVVLGATRMARQGPAPFRSAVAWLAVPFGFALGGALATVHPFNVRYAILAFPPFLLFLAAGVLGTPAGWRRLAVSAGLGGFALWSLLNYFANERYWRDDNRSAGRYLSRAARTGDLVLATAGHTAQNLRYYYGGPAVTVLAYPADSGRAIPVSGPGLEPVVVGASFVEPERVAGDVAVMVEGRTRVWLFASRTYDSDPEGLISRSLDGLLCRSASRRWTGVELRLYLRPSAGAGCSSLPLGAPDGSRE